MYTSVMMVNAFAARPTQQLPHPVRHLHRHGHGDACSFMHSRLSIVASYYDHSKRPVAPLFELVRVEEAALDKPVQRHLRAQAFAGALRLAVRPYPTDGGEVNQATSSESFVSWQTNFGHSLAIADTLAAFPILR